MSRQQNKAVFFPLGNLRRGGSPGRARPSCLDENHQNGVCVFHIRLHPAPPQKFQPFVPAAVIQLVDLNE